MLPPRPPRLPPGRNPALRTARRALASGLAAALVASAACGADGIWRCTDGRGPPVYQDKPCADGTAGRALPAEAPSLSVVPFAAGPAAPAARRPPPARERAPPRPPRPEKAVPGNVAERRHLREGMSEGEVLARVGTPDLASGKGGRRVRWTYLPAAGDPQTMTLVRFEEGRVTAVERLTVR